MPKSRNAIVLQATFAGVAFGLVVAGTQIVGSTMYAPGLGRSALSAATQCLFTCGMAYGVFRGGFGWAGILTIIAGLTALTSVALVVLLPLGVITTTVRILWSVSALAGLIATPFLAKAFLVLWRESRAVELTEVR